MIRLAVGLGNPGPKYEGTRHNLGRRVVEEFAGRRKTKFGKETDEAFVACIRSFFGPSGEPLWLATLPSFMNNSGPCLSAFLKARDVSLQDMLIIVDDFSLPFGSIRIRRSGSSGGHNGLKSIIETLGTEEFARLRLGIGPIPAGVDPEQFVLEPFGSQEEKSLPDFVTRACDALESAARDLDAAMNQYNRSPEP